MAWEWYDIADYRVTVGGHADTGEVKLFGLSGLSGSPAGSLVWASLQFHNDDPLPDSEISNFFQRGPCFICHMAYHKMQMVIDILRNEGPCAFGWNDEDPNQFLLRTTRTYDRTEES